ncbi:MAG TPA: metal ABC transporter ATP-binding protein [Spirochaetota bacterium]|nr:metal ABC transporter ATP-binding protein [Spirochaetota bacterium]
MNNHCSSSCGGCSTIIRSLSVQFSGRKAVSDISLSFSCGELTAIIGPNGGGKTSILKSILGEIPYSGKIDFCISSGKKKPRIGYLPQKIAVQKDSPVSVCDFLLLSEGYPFTWLRVSKKRREMKIKLLEIVSAENLIDRRIGELSGGELQRVLLAASINPVPDILLLDEPVTALDSKGIDIFYELICSLRKKFHMTILVVSHDIGAISKHADKMYLINEKVITHGTPSEVLSSSEFRREMGEVYFKLSGTKTDHHIYGGL